MLSGRESRRPRVVKEALVSPRPCRRIKTFVAGCEAGAGYVSGSWSLLGSAMTASLGAYDE